MLRSIFHYIRLLFSLKKHKVLIVLQNNNELRATGGFITHLMVVKVGRLWANLKFLDVFTDLSPSKTEEPPEIMKRMLRVKTLEFRDANFDPDFEKTAKRLIEIYSDRQNVKNVDSLWTVNFSLIEKLWGILRSKKSHENLFYYLSTEVSDIDRHNWEEICKRKGVIKSTFKQLIKSGVLKFWKWGRILKTTNQAIEEKELQFWIKKRKTEQNFNFKSADNFLAVIDDNYLGGKSNRYIKRSIYHYSHIKKDSTKNNLKILLHHLGGVDYPLSTRYQSNLRVYLPKDSTNITTTNKDLSFFTEESDDARIINIQTTVLPKKAMRISLSYEVPFRLKAGRKYKFKFIKQSGIQGEEFSQVIELSPKHWISEISDDDWNIKENIAHKTQSPVKKDIEYSVTTKKSAKKPRVVFHELISPDTAELKFNEIVKFSKESAENIKVLDKESKKEIKIDKHYFKHNSLFLKVAQLPQEEEKFYEIKLKNIVNEYGVPMKGEPRTFTVVYRSKFFIKNNV